ncbi:MAG: monovalent cation/H(+) antiporter subunit G [Longimicrobiales bacterium]
MEMVVDVLSWVFILGGTFFVVVGAIGVLRMPDLFTRLHAAGMTDTMGAGLLILGMALQSGISLNLGRLLLIYLFLFVTSPVASHALARAALLGDVRPLRVASKED